MFSKQFLEVRIIDDDRPDGYALTFSAITLRTWKLILSRSFHIDPVHLYMIDAWLGFVPG
jgi:hypothetical protein